MAFDNLLMPYDSRLLEVRRVSFESGVPRHYSSNSLRTFLDHKNG
jgi:hypothetical protein